MNGHSNVILAANLGLNIGCYSFTPFVFFGYTVVVIFGKRTLAVRVKLIDTDSFINLITLLLGFVSGIIAPFFTNTGSFQRGAAKLLSMRFPSYFSPVK